MGRERRRRHPRVQLQEMGELAMKVRYVGDYYKVYLQNGEVYDAVLKDGFYRIYDKDDETDYGYWTDDFEVVESDRLTP